MKVELIAHTPEPEKVVAAAAKLCYSSAAVGDLMDGLDAKTARELVKMLAVMGHDSPAEHASFTFAIEGVSRSLLAQLTRHRMASFSVQSQRYVQLDRFDYVTPPAIAEDEETERAFDEAMQAEAAMYRKLTARLEEKHRERYLAQGLDEKLAAKRAQKQAIEDARFVLPNACTTKMIATFNARSLNHFFRLRCCHRAQWEIRRLADEMLRLVLKAAPYLFVAAGPGCADGPCPEGKMSCGKADEVRTYYKTLVDAAKGDE